MAPEKKASAFNFQPSMSNSPGRPTWAEVNLDALVHNYRLLNGLLLPNCELRIANCGLEKAPDPSIRNPQLAIRSPRLLPVIKADAYGHGAVPVAKALSAAGATAFAVALMQEGAMLRESGISQEILVLEGAWPGEEEECIRQQLTATIYSTQAIRRFEAAARRCGGAVRVHIKIDTGMARLGARWDAIGPFLETLSSAKSLRLAGTYSHLASAEEDEPYTEEQIERFGHALEQIRTAGLDPGEVHFANSAGLLFWPRLRGISARPGIALYGYPPAADRCRISFQPALTLKTRVGRIHQILPGESVGYNRRFIASRPTVAATLPVGYADGYRRDLAGRGRVIIRDQWAAVLGAISMDMIVADVTDIPGVQEGEDVILLGSTPRCHFDAADWAGLTGTIPYEILCGLGPRVPRIYRGSCSPETC